MQVSFKSREEKAEMMKATGTVVKNYENQNGAINEN